MTAQGPIGYDATLKSITNELAVRLSEYRSLLKHAPSKGSAVEQLIADVIERFVPDRFLVTSGFAVNSAGDISPQQDILVILNDRIGPIGTYGGFGVYPIENVFASIEVKTSLTAKELKSAMKSLAALRDLAPLTPGESHVSSKPGNLIRANVPVCGPFTGIFALESTMANETLLQDAQNDESNLAIRSRLNGIFVHDKSSSCWIDRAFDPPRLAIDPQATNHIDASFDWEARNLEFASSRSSAEQNLQIFLGLLLGFIEWYKPPHLNLNSHLLRGVSLKFDV